jgi:hypothetical protein
VSMRDALDPRVNLEVALVKLVRPDLDSNASAILSRLDKLEAGGFVSVPTSHAVVDAAASEPSNVVSINRGHSHPSEDTDTPPAPRPAPSRPTAAPLAERGTVNDARAALSAIKGKGTAGGATPARPAAPVQSAVVASSVTAPTNDVAAVKEAWMAAIESRMTKAMFNAGRFLSVADSEAVFALPNDMTLQRCQDKFAEVSLALNVAMGRTIALQLVVDSGAAVVPDDLEGAAVSAAAKKPAASPAAAARTAITSPESRPVASTKAALPGPDDDVDLSELTDVPETSPIDAIMSAFPGTEIVDSPNP